MRKIDSSFITSSSMQPFKQGTWVHLQQAYQEAITSLALSLINLSNGSYNTSNIYALYGMAQSISGSTLTISSGAIYCNGEIYLFTSQSLTYPATHNYIFNLQTAYFIDPTADPVTFTDASTHNVHVIRTAVVVDATGNGTITNDANSNLSNLVYTIAKTTLAYKLQSFTATAFPASINLQRDVILYITSAAVGANTINIDFSSAISGTKVQILTYVNSGASFSLSYSGSPVVSLVSGSLSAPTVGNNLLEFIYRGKPFGNDFLSVTVTLQP